MATTVTINIQNNCGCCGGSSTGSGSGETGIPGVYLPTIIKPGTTDGAPSGYSEASSLSSRQCKSAVFLYQWLYDLSDNLANTSAGNTLLGLIQSDLGQEAIRAGIVRALVYVLAPVFTAIAAALGVSIPPTIIATVSLFLGAVFVAYTIEKFAQNPVTVEGAQDAVGKLASAQDALICALSKAGDSETAYSAIQSTLADSQYGLEDNQQNFILACMPPALIAILWFQPDWWPGFDDDVLSGITTTCCNNLTDGTPLLPDSQEGCQTAWYIVDKMVQTLNGIHDYYSAYFWPAGDGAGLINPFDPFDAFYTATSEELPKYVPAKVLQHAASKATIYHNVANYIMGQVYTLFGVSAYFDYNWQQLAQHLAANASSVRTALRDALDVNDAYDAVYNPLNTWITTNVTDENLADYMRGAIDAIIKPIDGGNQGLCNLMFYQDADLFNYAAADCADEEDPAEYSDHGCTGQTATAVYDLSAQQYNWVLTYSGNGSAAYVPGTGFKFTPAGNALQRMQFTQSVKHSVKRVRITFGGMSVLGHYQLNTSSDGQNFTTVSDILYPAAPSSVTADLCIDDKYIQVAVNATTATAFWVSKIEFLG